MTSPAHNPFRYGKPVPPERFIGRDDALRTIFARLNNCESTAIVGDPHIGKSSFLRYIRDERVRSRWLGQQSERCTFVDIDCHLLPGSYGPDDFWREVIDPLDECVDDPSVQRQIDVVRNSDFGSFSLKRLFDLLGRESRLVILLVDEFDVLLHHLNFNTAEFFGALRSLAVQTDGLALLSASRLTVSEMNRRSQEINPLGSPFFNNLIEVRLLPLQGHEVDALIDQGLQGTEVSFSAEDRRAIARLTGRHPFLVQIAAAALFEATVHPPAGQARYEALESDLRRLASPHFEDVWRLLREDVREALLLLSKAEHGQAVESAALDQRDGALRWLADANLIEPAGDDPGARWRGESWRIGASSFARWLYDGGARDGAEERPTDTAERGEEASALRRQLREHRRRLRGLEEKLARLGVAADPAIPIEIAEINERIAAAERELRRLGAG